MLRIAAVMVALIVAGCSADSGVSDDGAVTATAEPTETPDPTARPTPANRLTPRPTASAAPAQADLELVEFGFTYFPGDTTYVQFAVVFENPNVSAWVAERGRVNITWYKADGTVAGSTDESLSLGLPGQKVAIGGVAFDVIDPTEMEVQWRADWTEVDFVPGSFTFEGVNTVPQQFGGVSTTGNIRSSFDQEQEFVQIVAVYKDAAGNVLGGESTYADFVPAGGAVSFEISPLGEMSGIATTDLYTAP